MSKKLNIIKAMKMPIGTEFEVVYDDGFKFDEGNKVKLEKCTSGSRLAWLNGDDVYCGNQFITATFISIQQPVSFAEAIKNPNKKIKIEIDSAYYSKELKERLNKFMSISTIFLLLGSVLNSGELFRLIDTCKCYIGESEED